jgi:hypothetical protein
MAPCGRPPPTPPTAPASTQARELRYGLLTEDQHPVGGLGPHRQDEAFGEAVRPRTRGGILDQLNARIRQDHVEQSRELPSPIANKEPKPRGVVAEVHDEVAGLLGCNATNVPRSSSAAAAISAGSCHPGLRRRGTDVSCTGTPALLTWSVTGRCEQFTGQDAERSAASLFSLGPTRARGSETRFPTGAPAGKRLVAKAEVIQQGHRKPVLCDLSRCFWLGASQDTWRCLLRAAWCPPKRGRTR